MNQRDTSLANFHFHRGIYEKKNTVSAAYAMNIIAGINNFGLVAHLITLMKGLLIFFENIQNRMKAMIQKNDAISRVEKTCSIFFSSISPP
jgi:hypothetical protein